MSTIKVRTRGAVKHFRRAGHVFTQDQTELDVGSLTPEQLEQLRVEGAPGGMLEISGLPGLAQTEPAPKRATARDPSPTKAEVQASGDSSEPAKTSGFFGKGKR
jgi:hypothetical protein